MKITLLTDLSGKIICAKYLPNNLNERSHVTTQLKPTSEQRVHEVDMPSELSGHILEGTIVQEIFKYKVEGTGKRAKLVKGTRK